MVRNGAIAVLLLVFLMRGPARGEPRNAQNDPSLAASPPMPMRLLVPQFAGKASGTQVERAVKPLEERPQDKVFVGYVYQQRRNLKYGLYTHLCHAFLVADGDGTIRRSAEVPSRELTAEAHRVGVKVLLSLGGWGWDKQFTAIVSRPEAESRYLNAVMGAVDQFDYDGIDIDWEYPDTRAEIAGFDRLARRFRLDLDALGERKGRRMFLTMAASANPGTLRWLDKELLLQTMDWINVMTYDYSGEWSECAEHNSPLFASSKLKESSPRSTEATMKYLVEERKLPANRLAVGIPLYGRGFAVQSPYASTRGVPRTHLPRGEYSNLHKLLHDQGWTRRWDDETKTPWLLAPDGKAVFGYDDAESVGLKTEWAMQQGFRGVFFWQVAGDRLPDGTNPLQEAAHHKWEQGVQAGKRKP
jgi:chitinase